MSWGHDEYFYSVLQRTVNHLPAEALYIVRFHSFYPWHTPRNGIRGYEELANKVDWLRLPLLKAFQKSDLYSKKAAMPDQEQLKNYYLELLERYVPGRETSRYNFRPAQIKW
jgi:inositol oxygenase